MEFMLEVPFFYRQGFLVATRHFDLVPTTYAIPASTSRFGVVEVEFHYFERRRTERGFFFVPAVRP